MVSSLILGAIVLLLMILVVQDLRERTVSVILFPLLFFLCAAFALLEVSLWDALYSYLFNGVFLLLQVIFLYGFFWLRNKRYTPVVGAMLGWGDVLFWAVAALLFSPANFILFFLGSMLLSLLLHAVLRLLWVNYKKETVPLAGLQSLCLVAVLPLSRLVSGFALHDDAFVLYFLM